jgi:hypothetical protein
MLNSYFWIFWGLVDRAILLSQVKDVQNAKIKEKGYVPQYS